MNMASVITVLLILLALLALLAVDFLLAKEFGRAAAMKGWHDKKYFWIAFFLGIPGYLLVTALPDRGGAAMSVLVSDELPDL